MGKGSDSIRTAAPTEKQPPTIKQYDTFISLQKSSIEAIIGSAETRRFYLPAHPSIFHLYL